MGNIIMKNVSILVVGIVSLFVTLAGIPAHAQTSDTPAYFVEGTFFPVLVDRSDTEYGAATDTIATESGLGVDFRTTIAYNFWGPAYFGLSYNLYSLKTERDAVSGGNDSLEETTSRSEYGPTLGVWWGNARFSVTYFVGGTRERETLNKDFAGAITSDYTIKNKGLSGFQAAVGYTFPTWGGLQIGPTLAYRTVSYSKQSRTVRTGSLAYPETTLTSKKVEAELNPMITLLYAF
jgi:hypothetical protein